MEFNFSHANFMNVLQSKLNLSLNIFHLIMQKKLLSRFQSSPQNIQHCTKWFLLNFHFHVEKKGEEKKSCCTIKNNFVLI